MIKFLLLFLFPLFAFGQNYSSNQYLADQAAILSGYTQPATLPEVREVDPATMSKLVCHARPICHVIGAYLDQDVVYIRKDLDPNIHDNILLHEYVHWLQHHSGKFDLNNCNDTIVREREAYQVQNRYIAEVQHGFEFLILPPMTCENTPLG